MKGEVVLLSAFGDELLGGLCVLLPADHGVWTGGGRLLNLQCSESTQIDQQT